MVRFIRLVRIIDGFGDLDAYDCNRVVRRRRVCDTQTNRPLNELRLLLTRAVLLRQSGVVGGEETSHHTTGSVEGAQRVVHEAVEASAS